MGTLLVETRERAEDGRGGEGWSSFTAKILSCKPALYNENFGGRWDMLMFNLYDAVSRSVFFNWDEGNVSEELFL